ncbi:hypothetical protein PHMEG_0003805 [Phytophthora megakarya]|uniref:Chromo domain-containing protein n=1 Tax=Phytophthora megakarya TaxID=4795 RepID=A0A225WVJ4_9STRA|nr:hypothetical protein PHMEG_0003805 [Phytophthora megakarya]
MGETLRALYPSCWDLSRPAFMNRLHMNGGESSSATIGPPEKSDTHEIGSSGPEVERTLKAFEVWILKGWRSLAVYTQCLTRFTLTSGPIDEVTLDESDGQYVELLLKDSGEVNNKKDEYEAEQILDLEWNKCTRTFKRIHGYPVKWKGYIDPEWIPLSQLHYVALLYEFNQGARARARFRTIQAGGNHPQI